MRKRKKSIFLGILLIIMGLSLGYAFLTTTLNIEGVADIDSNTWDVYWDNIQVTAGSVEAEEPIINANQTTVTFSVRLHQPGDFYEFTVDAVNDGSIDAMIETITKTINGGTSVPSYLIYDVTYEDGEPIQDHNLLAADTFEVYKVRIEYRSDITPEELPTSPETFSFVFGGDYEQADSSAAPIRNTLYSLSFDAVHSGMAIPVETTTYNNYQDISSDYFGTKVFLQHTVGSNGVTESYVGYVLNDEPNLLRTGRKYYENNKLLMKEAFGEDNCHVVEDEAYEYCWCRIQNEVYAYARSTGYVYTSDGMFDCHATETGDCSCAETC